MIHGHAAYVAAAAKVRMTTTVIAMASSLLREFRSATILFSQNCLTKL